MLVYKILPNFRNSVAFGGFRPFAIPVRAACRKNLSTHYVWSDTDSGKTVVLGENKHVPAPLGAPQISHAQV